jgi:hypothetical protein
MPKVYVDTSVLKFSATELPRFRPQLTTINWGGMTQSVTVHEIVTINPNDRNTNPKQKYEAEFLPSLADLGRRGVIDFFANIETRVESWGLPKMDSETGLFYGAPLRMVEAPIQYSRILFNASRNARDDQFRFLDSLGNKRLLEWQKATGAYQGTLARNHNQLLDAFQLWCAEHNCCKFFLTLDFKLIRVLRSGKHKSPLEALRPSELLRRLKPPAAPK